LSVLWELFCRWPLRRSTDRVNTWEVFPTTSRMGGDEDGLRAAV